MWPGLLLLSSIALALFCVFDVMMTDAASVRMRSRAYWSLVVLIPLLGALAWLSAGRPEHAGLTPGSVRRPATVGRPMVLGPDDDHAFIQSLADRLRGEGEA